MTSPASSTGNDTLRTAREHFQKGRYAEADELCRQLIEANPNEAEALQLRGLALEKLYRFDEAIDEYQRLRVLQPQNALTEHKLAEWLQQRGRPHEALEAVQRALRLRPEFPMALCTRGKIYRELGWIGPAADSFLWALFQRPNFPEAAINLVSLYFLRGLLDDAEATLRRSLQVAPQHSGLLSQLGNVLLAEGRQEEALDMQRRVRQLALDDAASHSNLLRCEQYASGVTPAALLEAHTAWDKQHAKPLRAQGQPFTNVPDPERRLRLGFVSTQFTRRPIGSLLIRALEALAQRDCEIVCYAAVDEPDAFTTRFQALARPWRDMRALSDEVLAQQVRADGIDVLFDLDGHGPNHRLLLFARKPAPVQMAWLGYPGTTGLSAMDYLLADPYHVAPESERFYSEQILRLPHDYGCYEPPTDAPPVGPLPARANGYVTFGCFNGLAKITPQMVQVWSRLLRHAPRSRLILQHRSLNSEATLQRYRALLATHQIAAERVELIGVPPSGQTFAAYQRVDLMLDPFPYSGNWTTCEALWMGVPVLTRPGETFAGRHALAHLSNLGLTEMVAPDLGAYIERAAQLAADVDHLAELRARLRERMAQSPLCDGARFADDWLKLVRSAWQRWCEENAPPSPPPEAPPPTKTRKKRSSKKA